MFVKCSVWDFSFRKTVHVQIFAFLVFNELYVGILYESKPTWVAPMVKAWETLKCAHLKVLGPNPPTQCYSQCWASSYIAKL
jgi:hypothetical protein